MEIKICDQCGWEWGADSPRDPGACPECGWIQDPKNSAPDLAAWNHERDPEQVKREAFAFGIGVLGVLILLSASIFALFF